MRNELADYVGLRCTATGVCKDIRTFDWRCSIGAVLHDVVIMGTLRNFIVKTDHIWFYGDPDKNKMLQSTYAIGRNVVFGGVIETYRRGNGSLNYGVNLDRSMISLSQIKKTLIQDPKAYEKIRQAVIEGRVFYDVGQPSNWQQYSQEMSNLRLNLQRLQEQHNRREAIKRKIQERNV